MQLATAFRPYWDDMDRCRTAKAYWSLLHVTVCLPDICAALGSPDGKTTGKLYIAWVDQFLPDPLLTGAERYRMRCKVLHEGRAGTNQPGRYSGFSFGQPAETGEVDHKRVEGTTLHLDVGKLADETKAGVDRWIGAIRANHTSADFLTVQTNLPNLVRLNRVVLIRPEPGVGFSISIVNKTN
jgi:hypothetical protein